MTSQQIDQLVWEEPIRAASHLREVFIPGPFAPAAADSRPMSVLEHTLSRGEGHLQDALVLFEQTGEHRLADALSTLILRVVDRMGEVAEEGDDAA